MLQGKELIHATLRHEVVDVVPWIPFAGVHAGKLKGYSATEVLTDGSKLLASLLEANRQYQPDGQPVFFDLQVEAEILGCGLAWAEQSPPTVITHPLAEKLEVPTHIPEKTDGRLPMILDVMRRMKQSVGDATALYGLLCGPLTLASHLRGSDLFLDTYDNPEFLAGLLDYTTEVSRRLAEYYIEAGMDVIAIVDPIVSQVSPKHCRELLGERCRGLFEMIRQAGRFSSFFVCGDATRNIEEMCRMEPDSISIDENIDMVAAKQVTDHHNIALGGNIPLTSLMLLGTQQDNMKYVVDLLDKLDHRNLIIAPGCDMPYDVPIENVVGVLQAIRDSENVRVLLKGYQADAGADDVEMPDYAHLGRPLIEVFTIDSATCPACFYMFDATRAACAQLAGRVDMVERKGTDRANIARAKKLGIRNLPAIFINGELKFSSIIPGRKELIDEIQKYL